MRTLLLLFFIFFTLLSNAQNNCPQGRYVSEIFSNVQKSENIQYGSADPYGIINNQNLYLDVFEPVGDTLPLRPLVLHQFGGGFLIGWRTEPVIPQMGESYAKRGFVFATIDYRLGFNVLDGQSAERAVYRAAQDLRAALRFLVDNAATYGIDTSQIYLTGTSAGCLAAFVNTYMNESDRVDIPSTYGILLEPQDLGCANCSGNNNNNNQEVPVKGIINNWGAILDTSYINVATDPADNVPVISFHGTEDFIVPYNSGYPFSLPIFPEVHGSELIHQRLTEQGIKNRLYPLVGLGHEPQLLQLQGWVTDTILQLGSEFVHEIMQPQTTEIFGDTTGCLGETNTYFVDLNIGNGYCWEVLGGNIVSQNANVIEVEWTNLGWGRISVQEHNYLHAATSKELYVEIGNASDASFTYTSNDGYFEFENTSTDGLFFTYDFGDGHIFNSQNSFHQYNDTGSFNVSLAVTNAFCTVQYSETIVSDLCPNTDFTYTIEDSLVQFENTSSFENELVWLFADGSTSNADNVLMPLPEGTQNATLIAINDFCSDTLTLEIDVIYCPDAAFEYTTNGLSVTFNNTSSNNYISFWDFGNGQTNSSNTPTITYDSEGEYEVQLIVYNSLLCSDTIWQTISVSNAPIDTLNTSISADNELSWNIYPNPSNDKIYVTGLTEIESLDIYNPTGEKVMHTAATIVSLEHLPAGVYTVIVQTKHSVFTKKVRKY